MSHLCNKNSVEPVRWFVVNKDKDGLEKKMNIKIAEPLNQAS